MSEGVKRIALARQKQVDKGFTPEHDAEHKNGELLEAASEYIIVADYHRRYPDAPVDPAMHLDVVDLHGLPASQWPWEREAFHPSADPIKNLEKAGALIAAEIDRLLREAK